MTTVLDVNVKEKTSKYKYTGELLGIQVNDITKYLFRRINVDKQHMEYFTLQV